TDTVVLPPVTRLITGVASTTMTATDANQDGAITIRMPRMRPTPMPRRQIGGRRGDGADVTVRAYPARRTARGRNRVGRGGYGDRDDEPAGTSRSGQRRGAPPAVAVPCLGLQVVPTEVPVPHHRSAARAAFGRGRSGHPGACRAAAH